MTQVATLLTPLQAIRAKCANCRGSGCIEAEECNLYDLGMGQLRFVKGLSPLEAIRTHCLWCSVNNTGIKHCSVFDCELYAYRSGYTPKSSKYWV